MTTIEKTAEALRGKGYEVQNALRRHARPLPSLQKPRQDLQRASHLLAKDELYGHGSRPHQRGFGILM